MSINKHSNKFYTLNEHILKEVENNPYLGVQFQNDLKWTAHINNVTKKANSTLSFIHRNLRFCPEKSKKTAYISLVRSKMDYGAVVWDPYLESDIDKLERIRRRAAKLIKGNYRSREPGCITRMLGEIGLQQLSERRSHQ